MIAFFPPMVSLDVEPIMLELSDNKAFSASQIVTCCQKNIPLLCNITGHEKVEHEGLVTYMSPRDQERWKRVAHDSSSFDDVYFSKMKNVPDSIGVIFSDLFLRDVLEDGFLNQDPIVSFQSKFIVLLAESQNPLILSVLPKESLVVSDGFCSNDIIARCQFFVFSCEERTSFYFNARDQNGKPSFEKW